jgi:hypothetical protein
MASPPKTVVDATPSPTLTTVGDVVAVRTALLMAMPVASNAPATSSMPETACSTALGLPHSMLFAIVLTAYPPSRLPIERMRYRVAHRHLDAVRSERRNLFLVAWLLATVLHRVILPAPAAERAHSS